MKTPTIKIAKFGTIINERPKRMCYTEYKQALKEQKLRLKSRLNGVMCYVVKEIITTEVSGKKYQSVRNYPTATRSMIANLIIEQR